MAFLSFSKRLSRGAQSGTAPAFLLLALALVALAVSPARATTTFIVGQFEIDGNTPDDSGAGDPIDWDTAFPPTVGRADFTDGVDQADTTAFEGGDKNDLPGDWGCATGIGPNKVDIVNGSVAFRGVDTDLDPNTPQEQFVYVDFTRATATGSAHMDYEFNQSGATTTPCNFPIRTNGDLLITFDQTGGNIPGIAIRVFEWVGNSAAGTFTELAVPASAFAGHVSVDGLFGEAALNLSAINREICTQFLQVWMKTRSSFSETSNLTDYTNPEPVVVCDDLNECTDNVCDPNAPTFCSFPTVEPSTPCTDTDGDSCTTAGCDVNGVCAQDHIVKECVTDECNTGQCDQATGLCIPEGDSTPCDDTDGNACTSAGCESGGGEVGTCVQTHLLAPDSSPCPDTGNECADAGCDGAGNCDQLHVLAPDSSPCTDSDGNACSTAGCDGAGSCDQNHVVKPCTSDECNTGQCDPATGLCIPASDSTPCTDSDGNECTEAGCEATGEVGSCVQTHVQPDSKPCADTDATDCGIAGCDGAGNCDQSHIDVQESTPCPDTDGDVCTIAGCDGLGSCDQEHLSTEDSTSCPDTDNNSCTQAGCDGSGNCDQGHLTFVQPLSTQASRAYGVRVDFPLGTSIFDPTGPLSPPLESGPLFIDASPDSDLNNPDQIACIGPDPACLLNADPVARVGVLTVEESGSADASGATSSATATTASVKLVDSGGGDFVVTADALKAVANCDASEGTAGSDVAGSVLENVTIGDLNFDTVKEPTTVVVDTSLGTATVKLLEKIPSGAAAGVIQPVSFTYSSGMTVNAIHINIVDGMGTTVLDVIVGHAECSAAFSNLNTCEPVPHVSGAGFVLGVTADEDLVDPPTLLDLEVARVDLPSTGGSDDATAKHIGPITDGTNTLVESNSAFSHTEGTVDNANNTASSSTHAEVEGLRVIDTGAAPTNPLVSANVVRAQCTSTTSGGGASTGGTTLAGLSIGGTDVCMGLNLSPSAACANPAICCEPPPNTDACAALSLTPICTAAGVSIILNEQSGAAAGNPTDITVNAIHVKLLDSLPPGTGADVIISSAHCDAGVP